MNGEQWNPLTFLPLFMLTGHLSVVSTHEQFHIRYAITENQPQDMRIGKLDEDLLQMPEVQSTEVFQLIQSNKFGLIKYQLREPSHYFRLHEVTSELTTSVSIDLEALCPRFCKDGSSRAQLTLIVNLLHSNRMLAVIFVEVTVIDMDDNPPHFPSTVPRPFLLQLKEVIYREGKQIELPKAVDEDVQSDHAEINYRLEPHPEDRANSLEVFQLMVKNDSRLMLALQMDLDYEQVKLYRFYLVAWSSSLEERKEKVYLNAPQPHFQDRLEIIVHVLNINDIEPFFPQPVYSISVPEDVDIGTTIFVLQAVDRDENSTILYTMEGDQEPSLAVPIRIQPDGQVLISSTLDYEKHARYEFNVRASDGEFYAMTRLEINVTDVNDEPPDFVTSPKVLQIEENASGQTMVGQIFIIDRDTPGVNGQVTCHEPQSLANRQPLMFVPEAKEPETIIKQSAGGSDIIPPINVEQLVYLRFNLYTRFQFDRETPPHVQKSIIICSDGQAQPDTLRRMTSTLSVMLSIRDQNDNPPLFEKALYEADLKENCATGTRVIQVQAIDADSEPFAKPKYQLVKNDLFGMHFDIEPESGWIVTKANIDRETQSLYQLTVLAIDGHKMESNVSSVPDLTPLGPTTTQHTATTHVHVRVLDDNDNAPEFRGPRQFAVEENQPSHKWIGDLQVLDRDEGVNREVQFEMSFKRSTMKGQEFGKNRTTASDSWTLNIPISLSKNGSLYTTETLDRENQSHYCFEVLARDQSLVKSLSSADTICVRILDLNDNAPQIRNIKGSVTDGNQTRSISASEITIPVSVHEVPGYCALIVEAIDADEGRNALLRYGVNMTTNATSKTLAPDTFIIDPQSGRLMLTRNLNFAEIGTYTLTLTVEDSGTPSLRTEKAVYIVIEDSPARGNWLLPELDHSLGSSANSSNELDEAHTILIVIALAGVSAFLAAALISAILCMVRPCCNRRNRVRRTADGVHNKPPMIADRTIKCSIDNGTMFTDYDGQGYNEYRIKMLNGNGYIETVDDGINPRGVLLTATAPIPGFDQVYLPTDKLIGVGQELPSTLRSTNSELNCLCGSPDCTAVTIASSIGHLPHGLPLCQYSLSQTIPPAWMNSSNRQSLWTPLPANAIPAALDQCQIFLESEGNSKIPHQIEGSNNCSSTSSPPLVSPKSASLFSPQRTSSNVFSFRINTSKPNGERHGSGEEQRSDSGRGASDEEVPSLCHNPIPGANQGSNLMFTGRKQFHVMTLKTFPDNNVPVVQGILFPSLPRMNQVNLNMNDKRLTTFERTSPPPTTADMTDSSDLIQTPTRSLVRLPTQTVK